MGFGRISCAFALLPLVSALACGGGDDSKGGDQRGGSKKSDDRADASADPQIRSGDDGTEDDTGGSQLFDPPDEPYADQGQVGAGTVSGVIRADHFGWRPDDVKLAALLDLTDVEVQLRASADDAVVDTFTASGSHHDEDSGDTYGTVDFSAVTEPGDYYLHIPSTGDSSYAFRIADDVYDIVGAVAMKSFYFQRANHRKELPYASDALAGWQGIGLQWVDQGESHVTDYEAPPGPNSEDHGALDVHGGWFDAGDYQKTLWARGVDVMLWAYELNQGAWSDGQLNIPESGNGVPDILDELAWELDFYVRMQRPDGHFMSSVKGHDGSISSPPSASDEKRVYFDTTSPSGDGWSGGGVTLQQATGQAVLALAHAAIVFAGTGQAATASRYREAALKGWAWLADQAALDSSEARIKTAAAAAVHRLDSTQSSALAEVEGFDWSSWDGLLPYSASPAEGAISQAAWHHLADPSADAALQRTIATAVSEAIVEPAFDQQGIYGGMLGGPGNPWDWSWGSNRNNSYYGANLMMAVHFDALGSRSEAEVVTQAQRYLHYILGLNPLNMVYMTSMAGYGGEHSSFQIYHSWFSYSEELEEFGNLDYNGKPAEVSEPLYPYYPDDDQASTYGPAPGLLPGGPNGSYGGSYEIPKLDRPAYAYRDWSVGCDWDPGSYTCRSASWEITEPMCAYQGPFVLLASFFMAQQ